MTDPLRTPEVAALYAPHRRGGRFFNPWGQRLPSVLDLLRWRLSHNPYGRRRAIDVPVVANHGAGLARAAPEPELTWVGQSTYVLHDGEDVLVTDPHFGPRALLPRRLSPPGLPLGALPPHTVALLSHNHYDHLDAWTAERLPATTRWLVPLGLDDWLRRHGHSRVTALDWWQSADCGPFTLTCLPAQHWSSRMTQGRNSTLWCSWLVEWRGHRLYFAGDTGYFAAFAEFGRRFAPIDAALLPIGAYEPRWFMRCQHLDPAEAYRAYQDLGARHLLAMHWGTFDLTDEPPDLAPRVLRAVLGKTVDETPRVHVPALGETVRLPRA